MQIAQRLAALNQLMLVALPLEAEDLQQQPRRPLRAVVFMRLSRLLRQCRLAGRTRLRAGGYRDSPTLAT
jgi:hypothetical protein